MKAWAFLSSGFGNNRESPEKSKSNCTLKTMKGCTMKWKCTFEQIGEMLRLFLFLCHLLMVFGVLSLPALIGWEGVLRLPSKSKPKPAPSSRLLYHTRHELSKLRKYFLDEENILPLASYGCSDCSEFSIGITKRAVSLPDLNSTCRWRHQNNWQK